MVTPNAINTVMDLLDCLVGSDLYRTTCMELRDKRDEAPDLTENECRKYNLRLFQGRYFTNR